MMETIAISRPNKSRKGTKIHADGGDGKPLCKGNLHDRKIGSWNIDTGNVDCPNCLAVLENPESRKPDEEEILDYLNEKAGRGFRPVRPHLKRIRGRIKDTDGDIEGIKKMIDRMCHKWIGTQWEEYLRPHTLFGPDNFWKYYETRNDPVYVRDPQEEKKRQLYRLISERSRALEKHKGNPLGPLFHQSSERERKDYVQLKKGKDQLEREMNDL